MRCGCATANVARARELPKLRGRSASAGFAFHPAIVCVFGPVGACGDEKFAIFDSSDLANPSRATLQPDGRVMISGGTNDADAVLVVLGAEFCGPATEVRIPDQRDR